MKIMKIIDISNDRLLSYTYQLSKILHEIERERERDFLKIKEYANNTIPPYFTCSEHHLDHKTWGGSNKALTIYVWAVDKKKCHKFSFENVVH